MRSYILGNNFRTISSTILVFILSFLLVLGITNLSSALPSSKGLKLSPLRTELDVTPGTSQNGSLLVTNTTDKPITVFLSAEAFSVVNQQYDYAFDQETELSKWVNFSEDTVTLAGGRDKTVAFAVGVPLSAEPGGRYISLFATTASNPGNGINSQQRVGSLVYITVTGDVSRIGNLIFIKAPSVINGVSKWTTAIQNSGSTHFRSRYNVAVQNLITNDTVATMSGDALILPGTIRSVEDSLPVPPIPGLYKVVYTIGLGDTPAKVETRLILYVPPVAIGVLLLASILTTSLIVQRKSRKKSNRSEERPYK